MIWTSNHYRLADLEQMTRRGGIASTARLPGAPRVGPGVSKGEGVPRREHVRRLARDGVVKPRGRAPQHTVDAVGAFRQGIASARKGMPRYANPHIDLRARMWTRGWNAQHIVEKNSKSSARRLVACRGCDSCLVGTPLTPDADRGIYNRLVATADRKA